jgi:hypothetical protein
MWPAHVDIGVGVAATNSTGVWVVDVDGFGQWVVFVALALVWASVVAWLISPAAAIVMDFVRMATRRMTRGASWFSREPLPEASRWLHEVSETTHCIPVHCQCMA